MASLRNTQEASLRKLLQVADRDIIKNFYNRVLEYHSNEINIEKTYDIVFNDGSDESENFILLLKDIFKDELVAYNIKESSNTCLRAEFIFMTFRANMYQTTSRIIELCNNENSIDLYLICS